MGDLEEQVEIANPGEMHCPALMLLDTSDSMSSGGKISSLNEGLRKFREDLMDDELARKRVEVSVVGFGGTVRVNSEFAPVEKFDPPKLSAGGGTPMGEAILRGVDLIEERKVEYRERGIDFYRPFLFLFTDGQPTDMQPGGKQWDKVAETLEEKAKGNHLIPLLVGTGSSSVDRLQRLAAENWPPLRLKGQQFDELFEYVSNSVTEASNSGPGEQMSLAPEEQALTAEPTKAA